MNSHVCSNHALIAFCHFGTAWSRPIAHALLFLSDGLSLYSCGPYRRLMALVCSQWIALEMMTSCAHLLTLTRRWSSNLRFLCPGPRVSGQECLRKASRQDWSRNQKSAICTLPRKRTEPRCLPVKVFFASNIPLSRPTGRTSLSHVTLHLPLKAKRGAGARSWDGKSCSILRSGIGVVAEEGGEVGILQGAGDWKHKCRSLDPWFVGSLPSCSYCFVHVEH